MRRGVRLGRLALISAGLAVIAGLLMFLAFACSGSTTAAGGLELIVTTDLKTPDVFDTLRVEIAQETTPGTFHTWVATDYHIPSETTLPTTVSIAAGSGPDQDAFIRLTARKGATPVVLREVQLQVPRDRVAELKLVISSMCYGKLTVDAKGGAQTACSDPTQSCQPDTGACGTTQVATAQLPTYSPADLPGTDAGQIVVVTPSARDATTNVDAQDDAAVVDAAEEDTGTPTSADVALADGATLVDGSADAVASDASANPTMLPSASGSCPTLMTGSSQSISFGGTSMSWSLWVGNKASSPTGPIVIYWHGTGTNGSEAQTALGASLAQITNLGGIVAAAESTTSTGTNTGDGVWYTGDLNWADFIVACAIRQLNIDIRHIHAAGYSAGALQTGYMWYARSGYLASAIVYSGGVALGPGVGMAQDPTNIPPLIGAHGDASADFLASSTTMFEQTVKQAGASIVIDCDDGLAHVDISRLSNLAPVTWQFFKDHPFKGPRPDPYATLPSGFPSYCRIL